MKRTTTMSLLRHLEGASIERIARAETRRREVSLPPIGAFRWWARRTQAVTEAVLDGASRDLGEELLVVDPFAGGGIIPLVSLASGHRVYAQDLNPWAVAGIEAMLSLPNRHALGEAAKELGSRIEAVTQAAYSSDVNASALISQTLRVLRGSCHNCGALIRAYPHALVSLVERKDTKLGGLNGAAFLACPAGHLFRGRALGTQSCPRCNRHTTPTTTYTKGRIVRCYRCGSRLPLSDFMTGDATTWEVVLVERATRQGRELGVPSEGEICQAGSDEWNVSDLPTISDGAETRVLRRHGFTRWSDIYPSRQQHVLRYILQEVDRLETSAKVRTALRLAAVGTAEMAGYLSRWDRWYLKSYEAMARHRFGITTLPVEPNVWGAFGYGRGTMSNRLRLMEKGGAWLDENCNGGRPVIHGPFRSDRRRRSMPRGANAMIVEGSARRILLSDNSVDLVLTDPPYHDDVHYGELSLPLRAWAGLTTQVLEDEALVNRSTSDSEYADLLLAVFTECKRILKGDGHLVFSYSNRDPRAWISLLTALQSAGFRVVGYATVHSENESDPAKRNLRHCNLDMLIDAVPSSGSQLRRFRPANNGHEESAEGRFLRTVGRAVMRIGSLRGDWATRLSKELRSTEFVATSKPSES